MVMYIRGLKERIFVFSDFTQKINKSCGKKEVQEVQSFPNVALHIYKDFIVLLPTQLPAVVGCR